MKYVDEFADPELAKRLMADIGAIVTRPWRIMEVCGGQTHAIIRNGIDELLPDQVTLIHGPGCPVCVTPIEMIDRALAIAAMPGVIFCTFGDMLRVPGSRSVATGSHPMGLSEDLYTVRANGGDVRVVYSPLDALAIAETHPDHEVVFFGVGFETTAPANAMAVRAARDRGIENFSVLVSHVLVPPAIEAILDAPQRRVDAFLAAGHVCTVMGMQQYEALVDRYRVPIVVTGFEPLDVLDGIRRALVQLEAGRSEVENAYARAVRPGGNQLAQQLLDDVFEEVDRSWRGIGTIAKSGWRLRDAFARFDAERRFDVGHIRARESLVCRAGEVLQGLIRPTECSAFGTSCTPRHPLGAPMVSAEGACAAYHHRGSLSVGAAR